MTARRQRGGALLAVLWVSAALAAIVFSLAATVRTEVERAGGSLDAVRATYLAHGAIERFLLHLTWAQYVRPGADAPGGRFVPGRQRLLWAFPGGVVDVEITAESGKLNLYSAPPPVLLRLLLGLGVESGQAEQIAAGINARRSGNLSQGPSFSPRQPSFLQSEDLLSVPGMTPEIYYGWWERDERGRLVERGGLARYVTLLEGGYLNASYAAPVVMRAAGVPEGTIADLMRAREAGQMIAPDRLAAMGPLPGGMQLASGGSAAYTVRATAQPAGRNTRRSVAALVRFGRDRSEPPLGVVRWYPTGN